MSINPEFEERIARELSDRGPGRKLGIGCGVFGFLLILLLAGVGPYVNWLWYVHDVGQTSVFTTAYATRGILFTAAFIPTLAILYFSLKKAMGISMVFLKMPSTVGEQMITNFLSWIQKNAPTATKLAAVFLAFIYALGFAQNWNAFLLWRQGGSFGVEDPIFKRDVGFFVFELPWWQAVAGLAAGVLLLTLVATVSVYIGLQALSSIARFEINQPTVRTHLCTLGGLTLLAFAAQAYLARYEIGYLNGTQFTGAGAAGMVRLTAQTVVAGLLVGWAIVTLLNGKLWRPYVGVLGGGSVVALVWLVGVGVLPGFVQRVRVEPNKLAVEGPFAAHAIRMTRWAYGLDRIKVTDTAVRAAPTPAELEAARPTLESMRLWDPEVLRQSLEGLQGLRRYYTFHDVDLDRYTINGKTQMVMIGPRDINLGGLDDNARAWVNQRLQYTHGYGITMSPVDQSTPSGQPTFLVKDVPPVTPPGLEITQPRIYFSDFRDELGMPDTENYALAPTQVEEFDYPSEAGQRTYQWTGNRGIPIAGFLPRLAFSFILGDGNLLVAPNVTSQTRLLWRRNVIERARMAFPFLRFDQDPYIVAFQGRLIWILDAYTHTDRIPYSQRVGGGDWAPLNYIRNSVKVTVDAYTGKITGYAMDPEEPLLKAYRRIYPDLIRNKAEIPQGLDAHFRVAEDKFTLQAINLTQYHVTDPTAFLNNEDAWDMPTEIGRNNVREPMKAYYVHMQLPGMAEPEFLLILPFTPRGRGNMSGWLAARCDPEHYGELVLYKYPKGSNQPGPAQVESNFNQNQEIANINKLLNTDQSEIVPGNLLIVPIGQSVLYVKPLFLRSRAPGIPPIPELRKVILASEGRVVVEDTYELALARLFPDKSGSPRQPVTPTQPQTPRDPASPTVDRAEVREVLQLLDQAEQALREGNFARYGELQRQTRERLQQLSQ